MVASIATGASEAAAQAKPKARSEHGHTPQAALFATAGAQPRDQALDSVLHASLEKLAVVTVSARPGMDLPAVQLAIDCVGETPQCLRAVTKESGAKVLVAPAIERTPTELVISVLRFDAQDGTLRRVVRRQPGKSITSETLDAVPAMLRELFDLPPEEPPPTAAPDPKPPDSAADSSSETPSYYDSYQYEAEARPRSFPVGPVILGAVGALAIGGGAIAGLMYRSSQDKYDAMERQLKATNNSTSRDVSRLVEQGDKADTQATIATFLFGAGGAALVGAGIWLAIDLSQSDRDLSASETAFVPLVSPNQLGLGLQHRGGGL